MPAATSIRLHPDRGWPACAAALVASCLALTAACVPAGGPASPAGDGGRELTLPPWGDVAPELTLPLPEGFALKSRRGSDFDVHYITLEGRRPADAHGTIYVGRGPNLFHKQRAEQVDDVTSAVETIGGRPTTVYSFRTPTKGTFHREAIIEGVFASSPGDDVKGLLVHIACGGESRDRVLGLWRHVTRVHVR